MLGTFSQFARLGPSALDLSCFQVEILGCGLPRKVHLYLVFEDEPAQVRPFKGLSIVALNANNRRATGRTPQGAVVLSILDLRHALRAGVALTGIRLEKNLAGGDGLAIEEDLPEKLAVPILTVLTTTRDCYPRKENSHDQ